MSERWPRWLLKNYDPHDRDWYNSPATDKQLDALRRRGWEPPPGLTKGEAAHALDRPTAKMRNLLQKNGRWSSAMTFSEARDAVETLIHDWEIRRAAEQCGYTEGGGGGGGCCSDCGRILPPDNNGASSCKEYAHRQLYAPGAELLSAGHGSALNDLMVECGDREGHRHESSRRRRLQREGR